MGSFFPLVEMGKAGELGLGPYSIGLVFAIGVALGQAIQDNPRPGQTVSYNRTLHIPTSGNQGSTITP